MTPKTLNQKTGQPFPGVSVSFFCHVQKYLHRRYRGKNIELKTTTLNRWIKRLGAIEREYVHAVEAARLKAENKKSRKARRVKP